MKFEVSERIITAAHKTEILNVLEDQFKKISQSVLQNGECLEVKSIEASWGSINRKDTSNIKLNNLDDGFLLVADVHYRPSIAFWIIFIVTLFTYVFWLIPIIFYIIQKKTVREGIENVFKRIKNEFNNTSKKKITSNTSDLDQLEKLANLKEKGIITEKEFRSQKKEIFKRPIVTAKILAVRNNKTDYNSLNEHYKKAFNKYDNLIAQYKKRVDNPSISSLWSWNWPAFLFGGIWFLYKKQWKWFLFILCWFIFISIFWPSKINSLGGWLLTLPIWLGAGLWGDYYVYYTFKTKKIVVFKTSKAMFNEIKSL